MLYKSIAPVKELVPLKALFGGFWALLRKFPLNFKDSFAEINLSPSQAIKPIFAPALSITFKLVKLMLIDSIFSGKGEP